MKKHRPPFKVPEGYFDHYYERLMDSIEREKASTETSALPKWEGFVVPKGYFEGLSEKIHPPKQRTGKLIVFPSHKIFYYSAAAVAAVILLVFGLTWNSETPLTFDTLANAELETYFESHMSDISTYEIAGVLSIPATVGNNVLGTTVQEEILWEYLNENIEDLNIENYVYP